MLTIRSEQMAAMEMAFVGFEERMLAHIQRFFPDRFQLCGEAGMRKMVRHGVRRAATHGFLGPAEVADYISTMLYLGSGFEDDPKFPWVPQILSDRTSVARSKARLLKLSVLAFVDDAEGADNEHLQTALERLRTWPEERLLPPCLGNLPAYLVERLQAIHPNKCHMIGTPALDTFAVHAVTRAARHGFLGYRAAGLHAGLMFMLGAGYDDDPQFPSFAQALRDDNGAEDRKRERLWRVTRRYLMREAV